MSSTQEVEPIRHYIEVGLEDEEDVPPVIEEEEGTADEEEETNLTNNQGAETEDEPLLSNGGVPNHQDYSMNQNWPASTDFMRTLSYEHWTDNAPELNMDLIIPPMAPDGGWGWMIVLGSFFCMIFVDGMCFSYGIFLSELESTFKASKMKMTLAGSLITGCYLAMGPITSALANQFGFRNLIFAGSILSSSAFFLSSFIYHLDLFIFVFGVLGGIGFGLIYLPGVTIISLWFQKHRATATGIAVCGSGIGAFIYGFLLPYLINEYTWRGCILILAGISFNCAVAGALFRDLESEQDFLQRAPSCSIQGDPRDQQIQELARKYAETHHVSSTDVNNVKPPNSRPSSAGKRTPDGDSGLEKSPRKSPKKNKTPLLKNSIMRKTYESKQHDKAVSVGSLDNMLITADDRLIKLPPDFNEKPMVSLTTINRIVESVLTKQDRQRSKSTSLHVPNVRPSSQVINSVHSLAKEYVQPGENAVVLTGTGNQSRKNSFFSSAVSLKPAIDRGNVIDEETKSEIVNKLRKEIGRPMYKKDVFYSGSMAHLQQSMKSLPANADARSYIKSMTTVIDASETHANPVKHAIKQMLDVSILKSPTFILLSISSIFSMFGFIIPFQFLKDNAQHMGISSSFSSYLLSYMGAANTLGRILSGLLSDRPWADCLWINNVALAVAGTTVMLTPLCNSYPLLVVNACVFGLFIAAFVSLRTIMVVELVGLDRLTNAFGFLLLFQGLSIIVAPPLLGSFYDHLKNYNYTFILGGGSLVLSAFLCVPLRKLSEWENKRNSIEENVEEEIAMDTVQKAETSPA